MRFSRRGRRSYWGPTTAAAFDPATLSLTGWLKTDFAPPTWVSSASAGTSGGRVFSATNEPDITGATLNGFVVANFNGTNDQEASVLDSTNYFTTSGGTSLSAMEALVAFNAVTDQAPQAEVYSERPLFYIGLATSPGLPIALTKTSSGIRFGGYDGVSWKKTAYIALGTGAYHVAKCRVASGVAYCSLDGGAEVSVAIGGAGSFLIDSGAKVVLGGPNYAGVWLRALVAEYWFNTSGQIHPNMSSNLSYFNRRYALSLT